MKRHLSIFTFLSLTFIFGLTSCTSIFTGIYGMKKTKTVDEKTIASYSKKYNIPTADSYELDTAYFSYLFSLDTTKYKSQIKHEDEPRQGRTGDNLALL